MKAEHFQEYLSVKLGTIYGMAYHLLIIKYQVTDYTITDKQLRTDYFVNRILLNHILEQIQPSTTCDLSI